MLIATEALWKILHREGPYVHDLLKMMGDNHDVRLQVLLLVSVIVVAPISEELIFRGCLQTLLSTWLGRIFSAGAPSPRLRWLAILLTSLLFASVHPWWSGPPIFVLAICLGYAYERTGNLWTPIVIHALFNGTEVVIFLTQSSAAH
jgi:membrane protease YdiL (CAAX protease family)